MTKIEYEINYLTQINTTAQASLPLTLAEPIKLKGEIQESALLKQMVLSCENINLHQKHVKAALQSSQQADLFQLDTGSSNIVSSAHPSLTIDIGIDEVGRGPLYGSVVVAATVLPNSWSAELDTNVLKATPLSILTDSKKLSESKREAIFQPIQQHAIAYLIVEIPAAVIDEVNILQATMIGMRLACEHLLIKMVDIISTASIVDYSVLQTAVTIDNPVQFNVLIDGNRIPELDWQLLAKHGIGVEDKYRINCEAWVKGDARHTAIAAASVLAKVSRDRQLVAEGMRHPGYGLETHKGYPTKAHLQAIAELGVLPQHRRSFKPIKQALKIK